MVTSQQAIAATPIQAEITALEQAISFLTEASGTNGLAGGSFSLTDAEGNPVVQQNMALTFNPTQAAPIFNALIAALQTDLAAAQAALAAI